MPCLFWRGFDKKERKKKRKEKEKKNTMPDFVQFTYLDGISSKFVIGMGV